MQLFKIFVFLGCSLTIAWGQSGTVKSEGQPIPGATVHATQGDRILTTVTDANGTFTLDKMTPGAWTVDVNMFGFEAGRRDVQIGTSPTKIDFTLELRQSRGGFGGERGGGRGGFAERGGFAGRDGAPNAPGAPNPGAPNNNANPANPADPAGDVQAASQIAGGAPAGGAQGIAATPGAASDASALNQGVNQGVVPQVDASGANESFLVNGSLSGGLQTQASDFAQFGPGGLNAGGIQAGAQGPQTLPGQGGPGGAPGAPGGGPVLIGPGFGGGRGFGGGGAGFGGGRGRGPGGPGDRAAFIGNRRNAARRQIQGSFFYSLRNSALDAAPFSINGQANTKAAYAQNRFGFTLGGPLEIPKLFSLDRTFFFVNYTGNLLRNGVNLITTVPTSAERSGDFSALTSVLYDPTTGVPLPQNRITLINPIAAGLLKYIPLPNQPGTVNNYRLITASPNNSQSLNARVNQTLGRRDQVALGVNWQTRDAVSTQTFGFLDQSSGHGINSNFNWRHNFGAGKFNNFIGTFNRNTNNALPFFANGPDVATDLHIAGASSNPINFGPPNLSFTNFGALTDGSPSETAIYSFGFNDNFSLRKGKHNWSFGAGYTRYFDNTVTDANGRGTFTFTGLATSQLNSTGQPVSGTGFDFADFLLGLPQTDSIRFGSSNTYFRTNSYNFFAQDDWRVASNFTLNLGLRYEYFAPWQEKYGRIANLDIAPGFSAVSVVTPSQPGLYNGAFPSGLINPDRNNFAPRTGLAWKPSAKSKIVVRMGYGWYYNPGIYNQFMSRLSAQPPFANSTTVNTSLADPLTLATGLTVTPTGKTITNTFAVDRNYRDTYAQSWNVGIQTDLPASLVGEISYLGTKGTRLDVQEMPNQAPPGSPLTSEQRMAIGNAVGFIFDTPVGNSIYHAAQARLNRRFQRGISFNLQYTFAKSIDDSSTLGGAGNTVAQNFHNLSAERGLSSFDRRHSFTASYVMTSPVGGASGFLANKGWIEAALKDWTLSGSATIQSGTPLTARVLGNQSDTAGTGTIGSGRAQATGLPVNSGAGFFNLLAFTTPPSGQFGDAGRNTITGPGLFSMNLSLQRTIPLTERLRLQIRVDATNFTNHVNIASFGTIVNSLNYGVPSSAGGMRTLSGTLRFNF
ncbi:MAG TPA: TonB-dependent receptor [Bryobacteraceae bacterium]|nr:TonB-dependent receptor [Bryobacteraceae bacterium]